MTPSRDEVIRMARKAGLQTMTVITIIPLALLAIPFFILLQVLAAMEDAC